MKEQSIFLQATGVEAYRWSMGTHPELGILNHIHEGFSQFWSPMESSLYRHFDYRLNTVDSISDVTERGRLLVDYTSNLLKSWSTWRLMKMGDFITYALACGAGITAVAMHQDAEVVVASALLTKVLANIGANIVADQIIKKEVV